LLLRKWRVERTRVVNELTGDGNVRREQSMLAKRWSTTGKTDWEVVDG
jgi:hypothetical protein